MKPREHFATRLGVVLSMIGVAVGLGNVWRFPYMVGSFGGGAFVLVYLATALLIGVPALMTEWALGRETQRGTVGAFERGGLPFGRAVGWFFFVVVTAATAYYVNVIGWVGWHAVAELSTPLGRPVDGAWILPPDAGVDARSLLLQAICTTLVVGGCVVILREGLRRGIERASRVITPLLFVGLLVLVARSVTLPGATEGIRWLLRFDAGALTPAVALAALGQVVFSLALGGTFMVVYGSYLEPDHDLGSTALFTVLGDTGAGLLAGLAIVPAVFALGMEPGSGPGLVFATLPEVLGQVRGGWVVGGVFFLALGGAAFMSAVAAFEVLVAGICDNTQVPRERAIWIMASAVLLLSVPPMVNMEIFVPWDLTFGSGMQTLGALVAVVTFGWAFARERALSALASGRPTALHRALLLWIRFVLPGAILAVGAWWAVTTL
ncbi:MAG TPA: sodium-dependent transporter [Longimicrobiales bacterium]|nr:sodium-dependent transporter [Longimicrobiales bacterium]